MRDITSDVIERMERLQAELENLARERAALDEKQRAAEQRLQALRLVLDGERESRGETGGAAIPVSGRASWLGVGLRDAVRQLLQKHPEWGVRDIRERLAADGFDFKGKKPGNAVNMALVSLRRKQSGGGSED